MSCFSKEDIAEIGHLTITKKGQKTMSKERLVNLLKEARCGKDCDGFKNAEFCNGCTAYEKSVKTADYLLASGEVFVQPCKVGDTVYQTDGVRIYELEILDVLLHKNKPYYETESIDFDNDAIGKSIFLTREEAEAKLKESEKI